MDKPDLLSQAISVLPEFSSGVRTYICDEDHCLFVLFTVSSLLCVQIHEEPQIMCHVDQEAPMVSIIELVMYQTRIEVT